MMVCLSKVECVAVTPVARVSDVRASELTSDSVVLSWSRVDGGDHYVVDSVDSDNNNTLSHVDTEQVVIDNDDENGESDRVAVRVLSLVCGQRQVLRESTVT